MTPDDRSGVNDSLPRWLVTDATGDPKMCDGSPLMYHDRDTGEATRPVRTGWGYCAIVEAETAEDAAREAVDWLAEEVGEGFRCDGCDRPHRDHLEVFPYEASGRVRLEGEALWSRADA